MTTTKPQNTSGGMLSPIVNRVLYISFTALGLGYLLFGEDKSTAAANLGIALAFDPFNASVPFGKRPLYQRVLLLVQVVLTFGALAWGLWAK